MTQKVGVKAQVRMIRLILDLLDSAVPIEFERYLDEESWGHERTFRRTKALLNAEWEARRGVPLFETVDEQGRPATKGKRFLRLADRSLKTGRVERMAVMPAFLQYLRTLKGTIFDDQYRPLYKDWYQGLSRKERQQFDRTEKKFYCFAKGAKDYTDKSDILDEIYDALVKEVKLEVTYESRAGKTTRKVQPLTLVMFNTGLYLVHRYDDGKSGDKPYTLKLERILDAKSLRKEPFVYPTDYDPARLFDGSFGFIKGSGERTEVVLEFDKGSWVEGYLRERRWSGDERYGELKSGRVRFRMTVSDMREVESWVLGFGGDVKVLKPASLRRHVVETARRMLAVHGAREELLTDK